MPAHETEIVICSDGREISRRVLRPGEYVIGREADVDIRVEANLVSRRHARLRIEPEHALVEDLGSSNGTFVDGKPVTGSTRIRPGQRVEVGSAIIELRRIMSADDPDVTLPPTEAVMKRLLPEQVLGGQRYEVGAQVARGGMGAILDARESAIERRVAMKVMLDPTQADDLVRFVAEAKVTGQLEHPNIVPVHELGVDGKGQVFYTMKFVKGITLRKVLDLMAAGTPETLAKYPLAALLTIFQKACDAVAFAHSKRVIHRDLKPENIMLGDFGEVLVMDWGLAKVLERTASSVPRGSDGALPSIQRSVVRTVPESGSTQAGTIMGTPQYMSPEQARGEVNTLDVRSDIYSLGAILYHILALRPSVSGSDAMEIVGKVGRGEVEELCSVGSSSRPGALKERTLHLPDGRIPDSLAAVTRKAMALKPDDRYASVAELQADITAYQGGFATSAENASLWKQGVLLVKRHKGIFTTAAAAWALITALAVWFVLNLNAERKRVARERDRAEEQRHRAEAGEQRAEETLGLVNQHLLRVKLEKAREAFDSDRADEGLAWLAAVLRQDPQNRFAPAWLLSALTGRNFPIPAAPAIVVEHPAETTGESNTLVRFSPDGRRVFFNSGYERCGVWDVATGRLVSPELRRANVHLAEFMPEGKALLVKAAGVGGTQIQRWEVETGKLLAKTEPPHGAEIMKMALSPEGTLLATGDKAGEIRVWDARTLAPLGEPLRAPGEVYALALSVDDRWLAARIQAPGARSTVQAWDLRTRQPAIEPLEDTMSGGLRFHPASSVLLVNAVKNSSRPYLVDLADGRRIEAKDRHLFSNVHPTFSPDGARFATGGVDDRARVWDTHSGAPITPWLPHGGDVAPPQFSPEGLRLFTASWDQYCRLWDARTGAPLAERWRLPGVPLNPQECQLSPDGTLVATPARRRSLQLWDVREGRELPFYIKREGTVTSLSFSPDGTRLLVSADKAEVRVFDAVTGTQALPDMKHTNGVYASAFSLDGKWIATGSNDFTARLWDAHTGRPVSPPLTHDNRVLAVALSPDSRLLATGGHEKRVRLWRVPTGEPAGGPIPVGNSVARLDFSPDGRLLAAATDSEADVIELPAGKVCARPLKGQGSRGAVFSPDGARLAVATLYDGVQVFDTANWEPAFAPLPHDNVVNTVRFSPDGARLLSASDDGTARLWDARTSEALTPPLRHDSAVRIAIFSPDGTRVATATTSGAVRLWDADTGQPLSEPLRQPKEVYRLDFSPDGKRLAFQGAGAVGIWDVPPALGPAPPWLAGLAEAVAGRRVDERGELVPVLPLQFWFFRERLAAGGGNDPYARWAAWFFADRAARAASPWRETKLADEIARLDKEAGDASRLTILRHQPTHAKNLGALAGATRSSVKSQTQLQSDAETIYAANMEVQVKEALAKKRAAKEPAYTTGAGPRGFPRRDAACTERQLDLTRHYTHLLDMQFVSDERTHFGALPMGLTTLDGIAWDIRGFVHLFGDKTTRVFPVRVEGIPVAQRFARLHALQAASSPEQRPPDGTRLGHYLLRYKDGTTRELPIVYGEDLREWGVSDAREPKHAREAWRGKAGTWTARLFHRTYENPRPEAEVAALDLISAKSDAGPFVVAITVE